MSLSLQDAVWELEWRKCFPDWNESDNEQLLEGFRYFCETYWKIKHPDPSRGRISFVLREAQVETARAWLDERYTIVLKARQIGFSTLAGAYTFWQGFGYTDRSILMLSRTEREAISLLDKAKYGWRALPDWLKVKGPVVQATQTILTFGHDSAIRSFPSNNQAARGESASLIILDEFAFLTNPEETWAAVEPVADVGGRVIALSTANGEGNVFFDLWSAAHGEYGNGTNRFYGIFFPWWADGTRDEAWYQAKSSELPDWQMAQEYPSNPEEAFLRSGRPVFNLDLIRTWDAHEPSLVGGVTEDGFTAFPNGSLRIWEEPEAKNSYVIGADVAEGLEHGDYSVAFVLNAKTRAMCAVWHGHIEADVFGAEVLNDLGHFYNDALIGVERNNHGHATLAALRRKKYPRLYLQRQHQRVQSSKPTDLMGWHTTSATKALAITELEAEFRGGLTIPDKATIQELKTFVREGNGKMHGSPHDDRVMALAITVQMLKFAHLPEYNQQLKPGIGTFGWFEQKYLKMGPKPRDPIGAKYARGTKVA